ncbi:hypothetical protein J2Z70_003629 [Paenibacillus silagei]|uniref:Uncharacterized protein n=1 Tax=Paenibacillus silagei TaxID=1670801 RepID=A0ABS4NVL6_9BACL|nr:hypothetical protein [Paenibacillus silagei]
MNSDNLVQPINNVGSQVSNLNSTIVHTNNETTSGLNNLNSTLVITNVLLSALVLFVIIHTIVYFRRKPKK